MKINIENFKMELQKLVDINAVIPKPETENDFRILRMGQRRDETAVIYSIPCHTGKHFHYEKGITYTEFIKVINELDNNGFVTRSWFNKNLPACAREGDCNFTSLCGILELLGYVRYSEKAKYEKV